MTKSQLSFRLRQNAPQSVRKDSRKEGHKKSLKADVSKTEGNSNSAGLLFPAGDTAFKTILSARFCAAIWSYITDCDETFNYWEPMHYLVFGKGLQTWEYSPEYGLRSYLYLMVHAVPAWIYNKLLQPNPILIFYFTRCLLGLIWPYVKIQPFCPQVLPCIQPLQLVQHGGSKSMHWQYFFTALGSLLGWPFAALLGVPIAFDMLFRKKLYTDFVAWSAISALVILLPIVIIDSMIYGCITVAPFNIVKYNIFGGAGPNLYGTEPFSYYLINGFLNFNFVWVLALVSPFMITLNYYFVPSKNKSTLYLPYWLSLSPMFLWLAVFMVQEHKEERFLFPIYPLICLICSKRISPGMHYLDKTLFIMIGVIAVTSWLGISRVFALYRNYHAPFDLMMELNRYPVETKVPDKAHVNVCIGKDWHRYPSSFFLPNTNWNVYDL
ncbi:hypothetical protein NQ317_002317 [Molorchus minor]|uniref:Mannosyltransferase n=1 Tax=Molorchus minor TaxID=1323400 RepID=A0ABQ9J3H5_9CUCU|nr:hypothetical protein NQ317_002317 [Molorchus minor]